MAVEFPAKATAIFKPFGGMSHTLALMLFGIHSTKLQQEFHAMHFKLGCGGTRVKLVATSPRVHPTTGAAASVKNLAGRPGKLEGRNLKSKKIIHGQV